MLSTIWGLFKTLGSGIFNTGKDFILGIVDLF